MVEAVSKTSGGGGRGSSKFRPSIPLPVTEFDQLNNDCIRLILLNFSISELLFLRAVCPRWRDVIEVIFRSKHSLKLFSNIDSMVGYFQELTLHNIQDEAYYCLEKNLAPDELIGKRIDPPPVPVMEAMGDEEPRPADPVPARSSCTHLTRLLPRITKLIMVLDETRNIPCQHMLSHWTGLEELTIVNMTSRGEGMVSNTWCRFTSTAIAQMQNLKRLEIFRYDLSNAQRMEPLKPALGRLERLALGSCQGANNSNATDFLTPLLMELNPERCRDLMLSRSSYSLEWLKNFFQAKRELPPRLIRLTLDIPSSQLHRTRNVGSVSEKLSFVCNACPRLTFLQHVHTSVGDIQVEVFPHLSLLKHLTEYKLFWHITERRLHDGATGPATDRDPIRRHAMPSVKKFQLNLSRVVAHEPVTLFAEFFPALEEFTICSLLQPDLNPMPPDNKSIQQQFPSVQKWNIYSLTNSEGHFFGPFERRQFNYNNERLNHFSHHVVTVENRRRLTFSFVDIREMMREQLHQAIGRNMDNLFADIQNMFQRHFRGVRVNMPPANFRPRPYNIGGVVHQPIPVMVEINPRAEIRPIIPGDRPIDPLVGGHLNLDGAGEGVVAGAELIEHNQLPQNINAAVVAAAAAAVDAAAVAAAVVADVRNQVNHHNNHHHHHHHNVAEEVIEAVDEVMNDVDDMAMNILPDERAAAAAIAMVAAEGGGDGHAAAHHLHIHRHLHHNPIGLNLLGPIPVAMPPGLLARFARHDALMQPVPVEMVEPEGLILPPVHIIDLPDTPPPEGAEPPQEVAALAPEPEVD